MRRPAVSDGGQSGAGQWSRTFLVCWASLLNADGQAQQQLRASNQQMRKKKSCLSTSCHAAAGAGPPTQVVWNSRIVVIELQQVLLHMLWSRTCGNTRQRAGTHCDCTAAVWVTCGVEWMDEEVYIAMNMFKSHFRLKWGTAKWQGDVGSASPAAHAHHDHHRRQGTCMVAKHPT